MFHRRNLSCLALLVALAGFGAARAPLHAQPDDLVGFRLGQDMSEVKKARRSQLHLLLRGRMDTALRSCGVDTYAIEQNGERLEITALHNQIVKLDLSKSLDIVNYDPIVMAKQFVDGYGPPRKTAC